MTRRYNSGLYFKYCGACRCYEYDCHGVKGCIKLRPGYVHHSISIQARIERESK